MTQIAMTVDARELNEIIRRAKGAIREDRALRAIGARHLRWVNDNFREEGAEVKWAPLSPNTIAGRRKASSKPLQDTGRLRQSFNTFGFRVSGRHVDVGTENRIAEFHEQGTRPYTIVPRNAKALRFMTTGGVRFARRVNHPGLPRRRLLPSNALGKSLAVDAVEGLLEKELGSGAR